MARLVAQFTLTGQDYETYLRFFYSHTKTGRRHMRRLYALGVLAFLCFVWREYDHPKFGIENPGFFAAYLIISGVLLGGGYWYVITRLWPSIAQAAVRMSPQKGMFTATRIEVEEKGLTVTTDQGEGWLDWENVEHFANTSEAIYLFMGGINAFIIPKRGFSENGDDEIALQQISKALRPEIEKND